MINVLLIGCGNMGYALLSMWAKAADHICVVVVQPSLSRQEEFSMHTSIRFVSDVSEVSKDWKPDAVVLAIKPQMFGETSCALAKHIVTGTIISLMAGTSTNTLASTFPRQAIVRLMPNVAIKTGGSVHLLYSSDRQSQERLLNAVFSSSGALVWCKEEALVDRLTPISGCGPAFFFLLAKVLEQEALRAGLDAPSAQALVVQTMKGSASLVQEGSDFEALISSVASKGGVTRAALDVLIPAFHASMEEAVKAANKRTQELATGK